MRQVHRIWLVTHTRIVRVREQNRTETMIFMGTNSAVMIPATNSGIITDGFKAVAVPSQHNSSMESEQIRNQVFTTKATISVPRESSQALQAFKSSCCIHHHRQHDSVNILGTPATFNLPAGELAYAEL